MFPIPQCVFLTRGVGVHRHQLTAFEYALREADIEQQNLVTVSSILPPGCELIEAKRGIATLRPGEIILEALRQQPANRKQVNPGFYEVVDLTLGEKPVTTLSVTEGAELTLTTDGDGTNYACPR